MYLTREPIELGRFFAVAPPPSCGALATFVGIVRNHDHGRPVRRLYYEGYPAMANKEIEVLIAQASERWGPAQVRVTHRLGSLEIGEIAIAIAVAVAHRAEAFAACRFVIEGVKTKVPIWKKEVFEDGTSEWVVCNSLNEVIG